MRSAGHWTKKLYEYFEKYDPGEDFDDEEIDIGIDEIETRRRNTVHVRRSTIGGLFYTFYVMLIWVMNY